MVRRDDRPQRPFGSGNLSDDTFEKWFKVLMVVAVVILVAFASTLIWAIVKVILHYT